VLSLPAVDRESCERIGILSEYSVVTGDSSNHYTGDWFMGIE
jgi:hypothetical protein